MVVWYSTGDGPLPRKSMRMSPPVEMRAAMVEDDAVLLGPWAEAFAAVCGAAVALRPLDGGDPVAGQQLTFPPVFQPIELIGGTGHFRQRPALCEHIRRMGFVWNDDGRVMGVPAPGAFNARMARVGFAEAGFALAYANGTAPAMPLGPWLLRYMHGLITVLVNAPAFYAPLTRPGVPRQQLDEARWGLLSLAHDLSVHALNYHLVPHAAVADLAARIRAAVPERYAAWAQPGTVPPLTLTYFYDNDLNRYTYAVWCRCARPEDFASVFLDPRNYQQLLAALAVRLEETTAGRGDVASGDFDEMGPLTATSFDVR